MDVKWQIEKCQEASSQDQQLSICPDQKNRKNNHLYSIDFYIKTMECEVTFLLGEKNLF